MDRTVFPGLIEQRVGGALHLPMGVKLVRYSGSTALLDLPGGKHGALESTAAIAKPEADGRFAPAGNMKLARCGSNSITSKKTLGIELEHVLEEGMAVNDEELKVGLISIAAPVRDESRDVVAAIDLAAHASMISVEEMVDQLQAHLLATADDISARPGHRRDDEALQ